MFDLAAIDPVAVLNSLPDFLVSGLANALYGAAKFATDFIQSPSGVIEGITAQAQAAANDIAHTVGSVLPPR